MQSNFVAIIFEFSGQESPPSFRSEKVAIKKGKVKTFPFARIISTLRVKRSGIFQSGYDLLGRFLTVLEIH